MLLHPNGAWLIFWARLSRVIWVIKAIQHPAATKADLYRLLPLICISLSIIIIPLDESTYPVASGSCDFIYENVVNHAGLGVSSLETLQSS